MQRLWEHWRGQRKRWLWGCLMLLLTNGMTMVLPQLTRFAVDIIWEGGDAASLVRIAGVILIIAACGAWFRTMSRLHIFYAARDVEMQLRNTLYRHLTTLSQNFYHAHPIGDLMSRATNDLPQVRLLLGPGFLYSVNIILAYVTALPMMLLISWRLTLYSFVIVPPAVFIMGRLAKRMHTSFRTQQSSMGALSNIVQENLTGSYVVRAFAAQPRQIEAFEFRNEDYYRAGISVSLLRSITGRFGSTIASFSILAALYFGLFETIEGKLTVGELVAMSEYLGILAAPAYVLGWMVSMWQRGSTAMERLDEILTQDADISDGPLVKETLSPTLQIKGLSFEVGKNMLLRDIHLELKAGQTLGIVGPIGSGKTTLLHALMRLHEPPEETVFVDGIDVKQLKLNFLRAQFGFVPQINLLFSRTLRENIAFGFPNADEKKIMEALACAAFDKDLNQLPDGLETMVGERGVMLSGGQKQRASLARALILEPPILLLDDALASVDTQTESQILSRLSEIRQDKSTVIVAHRLTAVQNADHIVVLEGGAITQEGTFEQLCEDAGLFRRMHQQQQLAQANLGNLA